MLVYRWKLMQDLGAGLISLRFIFAMLDGTFTCGDALAERRWHNRSPLA